MSVIDSIRRVVAEDAALPGLTHEVYLRRETLRGLFEAPEPYRYRAKAGRAPEICGLPLHVQNVGRDCIATLRGGKIISVTNL